MVLSGSGELAAGGTRVAFGKGDTLLLPPGAGPVTTRMTGDCVYLEIELRNRDSFQGEPV